MKNQMLWVKYVCKFVGKIEATIIQDVGSSIHSFLYLSFD